MNFSLLLKKNIVKFSVQHTSTPSRGSRQVFLGYISGTVFLGPAENNEGHPDGLGHADGESSPHSESASKDHSRNAEENEPTPLIDRNRFFGMCRH